jgi:hypothetical protein
MPERFQSTELHIPAVRADGVTVGVSGTAQDGWGVNGESKKQVGVRGFCEDGWGVAGDSLTQVGVRGSCKPGFGVAGDSESGVGVLGICQTSFGVRGDSTTSTGVLGTSKTGDGVFGKGRRGVVGESETFQGVYGRSGDNAGVVGESARMHAVFGITHSTFAGVWGGSDAGGTGVAGESSTGVGVHGKGGRLAGLFEGDVEVTGDIRLTNADFAEDFDIADAAAVEPGTVMVLGEEGTLHQSQQAYDKRVAGVISGAGGYKPGIVLDRQPAQSNRRSIALLGKAYCKVDAEYGRVEVADLLTTSPTSGHAMKATDPIKALGAVIGKALRPLRHGQELIPILIALQ